MLLGISSATFVVVIFICTIVGLIRYQEHPERVFGATMLVLYASGVVTTENVLSSFSNQGLMTLIILMLSSLALEKTKALRLVAAYVVKRSYKSTWWRLFGLTAISSAFLNNTAVVSTLLSPLRNNNHHSASKLLLPLSYAAILGGTLTLVGTSTNLIVNGMVIDLGLRPIGFFEFTPIGLTVLLTCIFFRIR